MREHSLYRYAWYGVNGLMVLAIALAMFSVGWEYSTRRYLKGFWDAIVPVPAPPEEKIQAILAWMAHGPARGTEGPAGSVPDPHSTIALEYHAMVASCGSAAD